MAHLQAARDAADAEAWDAVDMDDLQPGDFADWRDEGFAADGSSTGFFSVSSLSDEYPRDGRGFEPIMLVRHSYHCNSPSHCFPRTSHDRHLPHASQVAADCRRQPSAGMQVMAGSNVMKSQPLVPA